MFRSQFGKRQNKQGFFFFLKIRSVLNVYLFFWNYCKAALSNIVAVSHMQVNLNELKLNQI